MKNGYFAGAGLQPAPQHLTVIQGLVAYERILKPKRKNDKD